MISELTAGDPRSIGPFRLLRRLGTGGMGQVYLGQSAGGRLVAVKVIRPELAGEPGFRARFAREVRAARNVSGLFTALVADADADGPVPWLATAYVPGPSLAEAVAASGPLPARSLLTLAAGLAEGLMAIHLAGVVHRDLKPSNVLLASDGPRVIDFGISRAVETSMLTQSGTVMGSPGFMSPEQANGGAVGPASDVFSLGAVLTFAATGEGPFGNGPTPALIYRVVHREPDITGLPEQVRPLVERCLAKDPVQRPAPADLLTELGSAGLDADWLPVPLAEVVGQYKPLPAAAGTRAPTLTSAGVRPAASVTAHDQPVRPVRHPASKRRVATLFAAAGIAAASTCAAVMVPGGHAATPGHLAGDLAGTLRVDAASAAAVPPRPSSTPAVTKHRSATGVRKADRQRAATSEADRPVAASTGAADPVTQAGPPPSSAPAEPTPSEPAPSAVPTPSAKPTQSGPATAIVPDVTGTELSAAASALKARGFSNIPYLYGCYGSADIDDVIRQSPGAGVLLALTAPVQLYLQAQNCLTVPSVVGMSLSDAAYTLKQAGFTNIPYLYGCYGSSATGDVVTQSPAPGTSYGDTQPVSLKLQADNC
jgi:hypothetical protein